MNKLGVIGGIGQGVMQGLQFVRQLDADKRSDQALQNQNQELQMRQQAHGYAVAEQDRKGRMLKGYQEIMANPDLTDMERYNKFANEYGKDMTPDEHMAIKKTVEPMIQTFGTDALNRAIATKDLSGIQKVLDLRAPGGKVAFDENGKNLIVSTPDARKTSLDFGGFATAYSLNGWSDQQAAKAKAALDARKAEAEIGRINEQAGYYSRSPQDKFSFGVGGTGTGKGGKKESDPAEMFSADYFLERFGVGKDSDKEIRARGDNAYGYYQMLHKSNPAIFSTVDGNERAFRLARDIDNGTVQREVKFDPSTMRWIRYVTDTQGGRYQLDPGAIEPREYKGPDGKPALEPSVIEQSEISALQNLAKSKPEQYRLAMQLSQAKELTTEELLAASEGKPITSGGKSASISPMLANTALMIRRRGVEQPKRITSPGGIPRKSLPDTSGYGAGGSKGNSLVGEMFDENIADPVAKFFKDSAAKARAE